MGIIGSCLKYTGINLYFSKPFDFERPTPSQMMKLSTFEAIFPKLPTKVYFLNSFFKVEKIWSGDGGDDLAGRSGYG